MNKIGIIFCVYGNPEYVKPCLAPWLKLKEKYNIKIAAVNGKFKEYAEFNTDDSDNIETLDILREKMYNKEVDFLYIQHPYGHDNNIPYQTESEIRDKGLQWLLEQKCDIIWLLDLDEFYTLEQIEQIIELINSEQNKFITWFTILMKNYIFSGKKYICGFAPPRIFRVNPNNWTRLYNFYYDNDLMYEDKEKGQLNNYKLYPKKQIPVGLKHLTWLHSNGKNKVNYQLKHFGHCSYKWNEEKQELEFDLDFYSKIGQNPPIIYQDEN